MSATFERRREFWAEVAGRLGPQDAFLVAEIGGEVVGFVFARQSRDPDADATTGEILAVYLRKAYWGRGIGRRLFAAAVNRLREMGFRQATLWVLDTNQRTRRFYEIAGWAADGSTKQDQFGDLVLSEVRYRVQL